MLAKSSSYFVKLSASCIRIFYYNAGIKPNGTSQEVCDPKCEPGQCCINGTCLCFDSDTKKVVECKGLSQCDFDT